MTHKEIIQEYKKQLETFARIAGQAKRYGVKIPVLHKVKYKRNISIRSVATVLKKIALLRSRIEQARKKRERDKKKEIERIKKAAHKKTSGIKPEAWHKRKIAAPKVSSASSVTIVSITYDRIIELLREIEMGHMSRAQSFYSPTASKRHTTGRKLAEKNVQKIENLLNTALRGRISRGMSEEEAKRDIILVLQEHFKTQNVIYELERLMYGMYDREYAAWGGGMWQTKVLELARKLELVENMYGDYDYVPFKERGYGEVDV